MNKFERVLSDEGVYNLFALNNDVFRADSNGNFYTQDGGYCVDTVDLLEVGRKLEQAVLAKLAEQEPVAWKRGKAIFETKAVAERAHLSPELKLEPLYTHPYVTPVIDKPACVSEIGGSNNRINGLSDGTPTDEGTKERQRATESCLELIAKGGKPRREGYGWDDEATPSNKIIIQLMAKYHLQMLVGADYEKVMDFGRDVFNYAVENHIADARKMVECAKCCNPAIHHLIMDSIGHPNKTPLCGDCTQEHEHLAQDTNEHEMRNFGGAYGLVSYHYEPLGTAQPDHIADMRKKVPEGWQLIPKEPTMDMIKALLETIVTTSKGGVVNPKTTLTYALANAPKYTGENT